jgi:hypothetical protein
MFSLTTTRWIVLFAVVCALCACRSEGERYVDELATTLEEAAGRLAAPGDAAANAQAARDYLEERAVDMRLIQSKLDDTVRTLNENQRAELADYARRKLSRVKALLDRP